MPLDGPRPTHSDDWANVGFRPIADTMVYNGVFLIAPWRGWDFTGAAAYPLVGCGVRF
jgi:hypothetical protein